MTKERIKEIIEKQKSMALSEWWAVKKEIADFMATDEKLKMFIKNYASKQQSNGFAMIDGDKMIELIDGYLNENGEYKKYLDSSDKTDKEPKVKPVKEKVKKTKTKKSKKEVIVKPEVVVKPKRRLTIFD